MMLSRIALLPALLCLLIASPTAVPAHTPSLMPVSGLPPHAEHLLLNAGLEVLPAINGQLSFEQVQNLPGTAWHFHDSATYFAGNGIEEPVWVRFALHRQQFAPADWIVSVDWALLTHLEWYIVSADSGALLSHGVYNNWHIPDDAADAFPYAFAVNLKSEQTVHIYLRAAATEKLIIPVSLSTATAHQAHQQKRNVMLSLFYGVLFAMFSYNLSLFAFVRHRSYAAYCGYVVAMGSYAMMTDGAVFALGLNLPLWLSEHAYRIFVSLGFLSAVWFIRRFLSLHRQGRFLDVSSRAANLGWLLILLSMPFVPARWSIWAIELFAFSNCLYALAAPCYLWYRGDQSAKFLTISWLVLIVSTVIILAGLTGMVMYRIEMLYFQNIGVVIEVLLLSMALAERINRERLKRSAAQQLALKHSQEAADAREREMIAKEHALTIERQAKQELADKVAEKTRELELAMNKLTIMNRELENLSQTDPLTGLANRRHFDKRLSEEILRAKRSKTMLGLLVLDIDHFKRINDEFGHQAGDKVIQALAALLQRVSGRVSDLPARLGGEEFCLLVNNDDRERILDIAHSLQQRVESTPVKYQNESISFTVSIGVAAIVPSLELDAAALFKLADDALYAAKNAGRNRVTEADWQLLATSG